MPVYCYRCNACDAEFESRHSMSFEEQQCLNCESFDVFKIPSLSVSSVPKRAFTRPGQVVNKHIRDTKEEIKKEKKLLRNREL